jgi:hypothetical protein
MRNRVGPLPSSRPSATTSPSNPSPHDPGDFLEDEVPGSSPPRPTTSNNQRERWLRLRSEPVRRAVYRMTPHNWLNFLRCHRRADINNPTPSSTRPPHPYRHGQPASRRAVPSHRSLMPVSATSRRHQPQPLEPQRQLPHPILDPGIHLHPGPGRRPSPSRSAPSPPPTYARTTPAC